MGELDRRRIPLAELEKVGVKRLGDLVAFQCVVCGDEWEVWREDKTGFLQRGYWHCPTGCNLGKGRS